MKDKINVEDEPKQAVVADLPGTEEEVNGTRDVEAGAVPPERIEVTRPETGVTSDEKNRMDEMFKAMNTLVTEKDDARAVRYVATGHISRTLHVLGRSSGTRQGVSI
ncbi:hypothetical protein GN244_ATG17512 [Phytophthora infestans]|uniref:Uncharacterized protein n=1 Tax=Phytophthora infestans TaxID=4787 RepID=A0A833SR12_PHYIN|nr:hypothetical protein GN244_ATG17512 [Phytophthora infestans]KAF4130481.1 hypothetical protein GN958_ATG20375 [Phytophthora infestans]